MSRKLVPATITFKTKIKSMSYAGETENIPYINYKVNISKNDCNLRPCDHDWYNSDMFNHMLKNAYRKAIRGKTWVKLSELPDNVTIDTSKFMAVVTVHIEV